MNEINNWIFTKEVNVMSPIETDATSSNLRHWLYAVCGVFVLSLGLTPHAAHAVPSYARQTGMACASCHTSFPELTPFGRDFKMNGYVLTGMAMPTVGEPSEPQATRLALDEIPPLSVMMQISQTTLKQALPDTTLGSGYTQNGSVNFPQQLSLFYAGRITPNIGTFAQVTYDGVADHLSIDNVDGRYADSTMLGNHLLTYGLTLNNNPTVQDPYNSTPAFGYPYAASAIAPTPFGTMLGTGALGQAVGGLGAYGVYHLDSGLIYAEVTGYRSAHPGTPSPLDSTAVGEVQGTAPYYRLAYEARWGSNSWEVGLLKLSADTSDTTYDPTTTPVTPPVQSFNTPANKFSDEAIDTQYQYIDGDHVWSANAIYIKETINNGSTLQAAGANSQDTLKDFKVTGSYYYKRTYGAILQYFKTTGDTDTGLYAPGDVTGSANGSPNSNGWIGELAWMPWENTRFSIQYTAYDKFNGGKDNYDGFGRNAKDNNTLYLLAWLMY